MILYLMRHGIAEDTPPSGGDPERRLTERGTLRTARTAKALARMGLTFDRIITSPYVRARQTAEIVARVTEHAQEIIPDRRVTPFGTYEDICDLIAENHDAATLLVTGHEPSMSTFISGLTAGGRLSIDVKKASVTAIELRHTRTPATGTLLWSVTPKLLESLTA